MEGLNPARTRALDASLTLPLRQTGALEVDGDAGDGSPITIAGSMALVEAQDELRAIALDSGEERWSFPKTGDFVSPASDGESVFIKVESDNKGQVYALDLRTGAQRWSFTPERLSSAETDFWGGHLTSPVVTGGRVFVGAGKELYALDARTKETLWKRSGPSFVMSAASAGDGRVYYADEEAMYALDQQTGKVLWRRPVGFGVFFAPVVGESAVYAKDGEKMVALDPRTGRTLWERQFAKRSPIPSGLHDGRLFVTAGAALHALDARSGRVLWSYKQPNTVSMPAIAAENVLVATGATGQGRLVALDARTGKSVWSASVPTAVNVAPVIAGGTVYVRTTDGRVLEYSG